MCSTKIGNHIYKHFYHVIYDFRNQPIHTLEIRLTVYSKQIYEGPGGHVHLILDLIPWENEVQ